MQKPGFKYAIQLELIKKLYQEVPVTIWAECIAALGFTFAMWGAQKPSLLIAWLLFNLIACCLLRSVVFHFYSKQSPDAYQQHYLFWLGMFALIAVFSGLSWGMVGSLLMVKNDVLRQTFSVFLILGVTAAANPLYSPIRSIYILFLLLATLPLAIWFFFQAGIFIIIGFLTCIYIGVMLATCLHTYDLLYHSLYLRFEISDLLSHLSLAKHTLEKRTTDLEKSLSLLRATLESTTNGILVLTAKHQIEDYNQQFLTMWRVPDTHTNDLQMLLDYLCSQVIDPNELIKKFKFTAESDGICEVNLKDGRVFECYSNPQMIGGECVGRVISFHDFTEHKLLEVQLFHKINYDQLTELPNRSLAVDRLEQSLSHAKNHHLPVAVMFLDIDRMKLINDTLGHSAGDKLLYEFAKRLKTCIGPEDTVARIGSDEFIIILPALQDENDIINVAQTILATMRAAFMIEGKRFNLSISMGISYYPKDSDTSEILIKNADIAMYRAKEVGKNNFQFFTEEMNQKALARIVIENQLRNALELNEFSLVYQPIVQLSSGQITCLEALLRWQHPQYGLIAPSDFIQIAEESGMIISIGEWVLKNACAQVKAWQRQGITNVQISVNLSARQFKQANILEQINDILSSVELDPHYLMLELTESIIMEDVEKNIDILNQMKRTGIMIVIDDFGIGYSSLNYLKKLPVDKLKIDRSFIQDIPHHADDVAISAAIIALARQLHMQVIAEGVENLAQLQFLQQQGCDEIQGFYFSKPLSIEDCTQLLQERRNFLHFSDG